MAMVFGIGFVEDGAMANVDSITFQRRTKDFLRVAQLEPVEITQQGRRAFVLMSSDHHDWLKAAARRRHSTADATDVVIQAVEQARMDPE